jgi:hypothetical protein
LRQWDIAPGGRVGYDQPEHAPPSQASDADGVSQPVSSPPSPEETPMPKTPVDQSLFIIWSSADPEVAHNLAFMYAHNARLKQWWGRVRLIIWGPSARLAAEDKAIRDKLRAMLDDGVEVWACRACADNYGVSPNLEDMGIEVLYVGQPVTQMLKDGWRQLTF